MDGLKLLIDHGGVGAYLIALSAIVLIIIGIERFVVLFLVMARDSESAIESIRNYILSKKYAEALQVCAAKGTNPRLSVIKSAILSVENGREAMRSALGSTLLEISHQCEKRLQYIALIANVATLLGLLGTITGLIKTFAAIAGTDASEKAKLLGIGISEAMYATVAGLVVGVLAMIIHTICTSKSDAIVGRSQDMGYRVLTWIEQSERTQ